MERLTTKFEGYFVPKETIEIDEYNIAAECMDCWEVCENAKGTCAQCTIQHCFDKLAAYEDAEEKGLLHKFPCKVGEYVYFQNVFNEDIERAEVIELHIGKFTKGISIYNTKLGIVKISINEIGKYAFLTKEEAEASKQEGK